MELPVVITFKNLEHSDAVEAAAREHAERLDKFHPRIMSCRVLVEATHRRPRTAGTVYDVRVHVTVPGGDLFAHDEPPPQRFHEDVYIAIRDAFDRMRRELEDYARERRQDVKTHEAAAREGRVTKLFPDRGYGFLETEDGLAVYFHRNSVLAHGFDRLRVGTVVRFVEEAGDQGPQASTVVIAA